MANNNPVKTKDTGEYPDFVIPKEHGEKHFFVTTKTELVKEGWLLDLIHAFSIGGKPQDFDPTPDIEKKDLGLCKDLKDKKFALISIATRINDGGDGKPAKVKYTLKFEADNELIDEEFTVTSTEKNPASFYTKITLKQSV